MHEENPLERYARACVRQDRHDAMRAAPHDAFTLATLGELGAEERALLAIHVLARRAWREAVCS